MIPFSNQPGEGILQKMTTHAFCGIFLPLLDRGSRYLRSYRIRAQLSFYDTALQMKATQYSLLTGLSVFSYISVHSAKLPGARCLRLLLLLLLLLQEHAASSSSSSSSSRSTLPPRAWISLLAQGSLTNCGRASSSAASSSPSINPNPVLMVTYCFL